MANPGSLETSTSIMSRRDPDFYIEDGNIVLSAKDSNEKCTIYFRIHKSTLVKNSPEVFGNMFAMPPPPTMDKYDGVPLVEMPDDAKSLREFIAILYDPQCMSALLQAEPEDFTLKMLGPVQLAKKYQVDWICKLVASQLQKIWPTTLLSWDIIAKDEAEGRLRRVGAWDPDYEDESLRLRHLPEPVSSIILARECDVPSILPLAFLHLLRFPFEPEEQEVQYANPFYPWKVPERALLSQRDWERLGLARERIAKWFIHWGPNAKGWKYCGTAGMRCEAVTLRTWLHIASDMDLDGNALNLEPRIRAMKCDDGICSSCGQRLANEFWWLLAEFFDKLVYFFQLDDDAE
ncbi:BTB domain-containing protein [Mycena venus]|uniref:BTB domain-containing protein n=1 Tax=Mycena venus TaxID=2733690 RepID=A0A8H6YI97_9AGAR|nr:BTB domain-containing protein [Mycena venus]